MMYYFKSAGLGYAADGTPLPPELQHQPAHQGVQRRRLRRHGRSATTSSTSVREIFSTLAQANFPILQANIADTGAYGLADVPVEPYIEKTVGPEGINVAILGIGNHRVPSYELPEQHPRADLHRPDRGRQGAGAGPRGRRTTWSSP